MWLILIEAGLFGTAYAAFLEFTPLGDFLAKQRTWISVVAGVAGCLAIAWLHISPECWSVMAAIFVASGIPIIIRSLLHEQRDWRQTIDGIREIIKDS